MFVLKSFVFTRHSMTAARAAFLSLVLAIQQSHSQSRDIALGHYRALPLPDRFARFAVIPATSTGDYRVVFWNPGSSTATVASINIGFDTLRSTAVLSSARNIDDVFVRDLNGDSRAEIVIVHRSERMLGVYAELAPDRYELQKEFVLPVAPAGCIMADATSDGNLDLILFERGSPGLHMMVGDGKGEFRQGRVVAPDNMIGWIDVAQLNDDSLSDIVVYDWVRSEMIFHYGVGRGRFLEQTVLPVDGNLHRFSVERLSRQPTADLVLLHRDPPAIELWQGDGYGDFKPNKRLPLGGPASDYAISDVNGDGWKDLVVLEGQTKLAVYTSRPREPFVDRHEYFLGGAMSQLVTDDVNRDRRPDVLLLGRLSSTFAVVFNGNVPVTLNDSLEFLVGRSPSAVRIDDANSDGYNDVLVLSNGTGALHLFPGDGERGLYGQKNFELPAESRYMAFHSRDDSTTRYVFSYPANKSISYFTYNHRSRSTINAIIPGVGELEILHSSLTSSGKAEFYCFNTASIAGSPSLSYFQELEYSLFIERSFQLTVPDMLYGAGVGDVNNDGILDAAILYRNTSTRKFELAVLEGDSAGNFSRRAFVKEIPEVELRRSYLYLVDLDHDGNLDLVMCFPQVGKWLGWARGNGDGSFGVLETLLSLARISDRAQIQFHDVTSDSFLDIVINDLEGDGIFVFRNRRDGGFDEPVRVVSGGGISHYGIGDLNGDGIPDLALSVRHIGRLRIYDGKSVFAGVRND